MDRPILNLLTDLGGLVRCLLGDHDLVTQTVAPKPADPENGTQAEPARLILRCVRCLKPTPGLALDGPKYHRTQEPNLKALTMKGRRRKTTRKPRKPAPENVEPVAVAAGGGRGRAVNFPVVGRRRV